MTSPATPSRDFRIDKWTVGWAMLTVFSAKLAVMPGQEWVLIGWSALFLFVLPVFLPIRFVVAQILATIVFLDASLWFQLGLETYDTIYQAPGSLVKPPELLLTVLAIKLFSRRDLKISLPVSVLVISYLFLLGLALSVLVAVYLGTPIEGILSFSEVRSPALMVIGLLLLAPVAQHNPKSIIDSLGIFILVHFSISLLSWLGPVSLLWESFAPNYVGQRSAFFGADESVMVYLLLQALAVSVLLSARPNELSDFGRFFWSAILAVTIFAIIASFRRGGIFGSAILLAYIAAFVGIQIKVRLAFALLFIAPVALFILLQLDLFEPLMMRLRGEGSVAVSDAGRSYDLIQAKAYVEENFWFGTGAGTKLALWRTQSYGVPESLSIHHSIYHVWVRLGVFGALAYALLLLHPLAYAGYNILGGKQRAMARPRAQLGVCMSGLVAALFAWGIFTPAIFVNFRQSGVWIVATILIFAIFSSNSARQPDRGTIPHEPEPRLYT